MNDGRFRWSIGVQTRGAGCRAGFREWESDCGRVWPPYAAAVEGVFHVEQRCRLAQSGAAFILAGGCSRPSWGIGHLTR